VNPRMQMPNQQPRIEMTPEQREMMKAQRLQALNPLPNDNTLVPTLREINQCPIAIEQKQMSMFIAKLVEVGDEALIPLIVEGISEGMRSEFYCRKSLEERTLVRMEDDAALSGTLAELKAKEEKVLALQQELDVAAKEMDVLSKSLWEKAVHTYGLATSQRCYTVVEDKGHINQVSLDCEKCQAKVVMADIRKRMTSAMFELQRVKKDA